MHLVAAPKHAGSVLNATAVDGLDFEFGTRGSRESGWERRSLVTPFVDTAALQVPGPGTYDPMGSSVLKVEGSGATILRVIDGKLQHVDNKLSAPFSTSGLSPPTR